MTDMNHEMRVRASIGAQYLEHIARVDPDGILGNIAREGLAAMNERGKDPEVWESWCFECLTPDVCRLIGRCRVAAEIDAKRDVRSREETDG